MSLWIDSNLLRTVIESAAHEAPLTPTCNFGDVITQAVIAEIRRQEPEKALEGLCG
jgi:hypothetical protein